MACMIWRAMSRSGFSLSIGTILIRPVMGGKILIAQMFECCVVVAGASMPISRVRPPAGMLYHTTNSASMVFGVRGQRQSDLLDS